MGMGCPLESTDGTESNEAFCSCFLNQGHQQKENIIRKENLKVPCGFCTSWVFVKTELEIKKTTATKQQQKHSKLRDYRL